MSDNGGVSKFWKGGMNGKRRACTKAACARPASCVGRSELPAGGRIEAQASHVDWLPTFCELAGVDLPTDRTIDGKSLVPRLTQAGTGRNPSPIRLPHLGSLLSQSGQTLEHQRSTLETALPWLAANDAKRGAVEAVRPSKRSRREEEPRQASIRTNVKRLRAEFVRWFDDVTAGVEYAPVPIPVGHPDQPSVEI